MRRRLQASGIIFAGLVGLSAVLHYRAPDRGQSAPERTTPSQAAVAEARHPRVESPGRSNGRSIPPSGWRRTSRGWEHVSDWAVAPSGTDKPTLNELVLTQESEEPAWLRLAFARLRAIPPLAFALFQLVAIGVICQLGRRKARLPAVQLPE